ncbi:MAG: DUF1592 domain-containing protein [Polyangiales bacterium]
MRQLAAVLCVLAVACEGSISEPEGGPGGGVTPRMCRNADAIVLGSAPMRRLTGREWANSVRDLIGVPDLALPEMPPDATSTSSFDNEALALGPSELHVRRWEQAAFDVGGLVASDAGLRARHVPCGEADADCARRFVEAFGRRALRRPLTADEVQRYVDFFEGQRASIDFDAAVQLTVSAFLQSPQFLYRLELGSGSGREGQVPLTPHEVASRLSYLLWESMPDDALLAAADGNDLRTPNQLEAQARRMLADPRARPAVADYFRQWLYLDRVATETKLPELVPEWSAEVAQAARTESMLLAEHVFFEGTLGDLFTSRTGFVPAELAPLYGMSSPSLDVPVELPPERAGILTRIAFLGGNAHEANGSPPLRGVYVLSRLLCTPPGAPPADADTSPPAPDPTMGPQTNRMLFEDRTSPDRCQTCHQAIDAFGFAFENYDAAGRHRMIDNGLPVDATGVAVGLGDDATPFDDAVGLQRLFATSDAVHDCAVEKWFVYANGRLPEAEDACQLRALQDEFADVGGDLDELVVRMVLRPEFLLRPEITEAE